MNLFTILSILLTSLIKYISLISISIYQKVHGCVLENISHILNTFEIEINSATDNPLIFHESGDMLSGGNFHGEYVAKAFDMLAMYYFALFVLLSVLLFFFLVGKIMSVN